MDSLQAVASPIAHLAPVTPSDTIAGVPVSVLTEVALCLAGLLLILLVTLDVAHLVRARRRRARRLSAQAMAEERNRALMTELCPDGWQAEIRIHHGPGGPQAAGPAGARGSVSLEWSELGPETGEPTVQRRLSAPTIADALEAMVAERRAEETLEQIERGAAEKGVLWPDLP